MRILLIVCGLKNLKKILKLSNGIQVVVPDNIPFQHQFEVGKLWANEKNGYLFIHPLKSHQESSMQILFNNASR